MKTITKSLPEDLKWLEYLQRSFELPNSFTHHRMKHRGGKQWPSQDMTVLPDIITRILLPYKKLLSPKDDCLPIFHLYNRTGKKVVLFKFKIHCPYSFSPSKKKKPKLKKSTTYLYRHHRFTSFHGGWISQLKKQKVSCSNPSIIVYLQHLSQARLKKKAKKAQNICKMYIQLTPTLTSISLKVLQNFLKLCCKYFKSWRNCSVWATGTVWCLADCTVLRDIFKNPRNIRSRICSIGRINFLRYSEMWHTK